MLKAWNRDAAIKSGRANTRDGRTVVGLREAELDGRPVLVGQVLAGRKGPLLCLENAWWEAGGLGLHGGDDLVDAPARAKKNHRQSRVRNRPGSGIES